MTVNLVPLTEEAAEAIKAGRDPEGHTVPQDYPTEFSMGVAESFGNPAGVGPYFVVRADDNLTVGELGGHFVEPGIIEIGFAIVESCQGSGYATEAVTAFIELARQLPEADRVIAHTPFERPASARVLSKAGLELVGEVDDEHEGETLRVQRWELAI